MKAITASTNYHGQILIKAKFDRKGECGMLVELIDGGIKDIYTETDVEGGCPTCDWGSQYTNEFIVFLTGGKIEVRIDNMYEHAVSEDYSMKLFLQNIEEVKNMTETEFYNWLKFKLKEDYKDMVDYLHVETTLQ